MALKCFQRLIFEVVSTRFGLEKEPSGRQPLRLKKGFMNGWLYPLVFPMLLVHS